MVREEQESEKSIFQEIPVFHHHEEAASSSFLSFKSVVESRRSVRVFTEDPIPESVMQECLELALLAPNSSNLQTWQFFWVRSSEKKKALIEACLSQPAAATAQELIVAVIRPGLWRRHAKRMVETLNQLDPRPSKSVFRYYEKLIPLAYTMDPLGIMGLGKKIIFSALGFFKPIPREPTSQCDMRNWATKSCSLACENLMLALSAAGYDSCPMEGYDSARLRKILNLPRGTIPIMVISAGKRAKGGVYGPRLRFDQKEFIQEV